MLEEWGKESEFGHNAAFLARSCIIAGLQRLKSSLRASFGGVFLSRIINPESAGKDRTRLAKTAVLAIRELMKQTEPDIQTRDLAAFVALALDGIAQTIEPTVAAWEKRDYWVKADRFRLEWEWSERLGTKMRQAVLVENWAEVAQLSVQVALKLGEIQIAKNHRMGMPWVGAWKKLQETGERG